MSDAQEADDERQRDLHHARLDKLSVEPPGTQHVQKRAAW